MDRIDKFCLTLIFLVTVSLMVTGCQIDGGSEDSPPPIASDLDNRLRASIAAHDLQAVSKVEVVNEVTLLGEKLFTDKNLSGNRDISCETCHQLGSSTEFISLSLGTGATGEDQNRTQNSGTIIKRNTPHLFNIADNEQMFFDGRVSLIDGDWTLPVSLPSSTLSQFDKALDAQTLFPLISETEMLGKADQNSIAALGSNHQAIEKILSDRVLANSEYTAAFARAYPNADSYNSGHMGHAIGEFVENKFLVRDTPYDQYLQGNNNALTDNQKRGFLVFLGRGRCVRCHSGENLTDNSFHSVGVPHIYDSTNPTDDLGLYEATVSDGDQYLFKTPGLRNISATGPYMHNGAFLSLREVINHYNNINTSLNNYSLSTEINEPYTTALSVDRNVTRNSIRFNQISVDELKRGLRLSTRDREDLEAFLRSLSN